MITAVLIVGWLYRLKKTLLIFLPIYFLSLLVALLIAKKLRVKYYQKKYAKRAKGIEDIVEKWNKEKFSTMRVIFSK